MKLSKVWGKRSKRAWFWMNFFYFQIFETFGNLVIDFSGNVNKYFWTVTSTFNYDALSLKLRHNKTNSKRAVAMPLHKAYFLTWIYSQLSFIFQKWGNPKLYGPKKVIFHVIIDSCISFSVLRACFITNPCTSRTKKHFRGWCLYK